MQVGEARMPSDAVWALGAPSSTAYANVISDGSHRAKGVIAKVAPH